MDTLGVVLSANRYLLYGEVRTDTSLTAITETDFGYTGQRNYSSFGLMDYNARYYNAALGRFIQPDTLVPGMGAMAQNRYMYVMGNPINYNDPNGHCGPFCALLIGSLAVGAMVGAGSYTVKMAQNQEDYNFIESMAYTVAGSGIGAIAMAILGTTVPPLLIATGQILVGAGSYINNSFPKMATSIAKGGVALQQAGAYIGDLIFGSFQVAPATVDIVTSNIEGNIDSDYSNYSPLEKGNLFHYDELNGSTGNYGPSQLSSLFPETDFYFTRRGEAGVDVQVIEGALHPSDYPGSLWPSEFNYADFKPYTKSGIKTFLNSIVSGKFQQNTFPLYYDTNSLELINKNIFK